MDKLKNQEAMELCLKAHFSQYRKDGKTPYATHPIAVFLIVAKYTDDRDVQIAALLHDVIEDTDHTAKKLRQQFSKKAIDLVEQVTESKDGLNLPWKIRKKNYLEKLRKQASKQAMLIKVADQIHNLNDMMSFTSENLKKVSHSTPAQKLWYVKEIHKIANEKGVSKNILEWLDRSIDKFKDKFVSSKPTNQKHSS